jgi:hypothetical protein
MPRISVDPRGDADEPRKNRTIVDVFAQLGQVARQEQPRASRSQGSQGDDDPDSGSVGPVRQGAAARPASCVT